MEQRSKTPSQSRSRPSDRIKGKARRPSAMNVMVVGDVGKVRRFRISTWALVLLAGFLAIYGFTSVLAINYYLSHRALYESQATHIQDLEKDLDTLRKDLERSRQYAFLLEKVITDREPVPQVPVRPAVSEPPASAQPAPAQVPAIPEPSPPKSGVGIEDLVLTKSGVTFAVQFRLVNVSEEGSPASGYIHMIAANGRIRPPQFWAYPKVALREGVPVDYKRGEFFKIKRFRMIRGVYFMDGETDLPSSVTVMIYDTAGALILEKEFEVTADIVQTAGH